MTAIGRLLPVTDPDPMTPPSGGFNRSVQHIR